jgi:hypothetical protein
MKIAYMNTDEVNLELAARTAARFGAVVCRLVPEGPPSDGLFDAVLYNLDEVPRDQRSNFLDRVRIDSSHRPTGVHGYDITDEQARALSRSGVVSSKRLHVDLLRDLFSAARRVREIVREEDVGTDLTWVDLAK